MTRMIAVLLIAVSAPASAQVLDHDHPSNFSDKGVQAPPPVTKEIDCRLVPHWRRNHSCATAWKNGEGPERSFNFPDRQSRPEPREPYEPEPESDCPEEDHR